MELDSIDVTGSTAVTYSNQATADTALAQCFENVAQSYAILGFQEPWISYVARDETDAAIGSGFIKGPPQQGKVELGLQVFPAYRGNGLASEIAKALISKAFESKEVTCLVANTRCGERPEVKVLRSLGFQIEVTFEDESGAQWHWTLPRPVPNRIG